MSIFQKSNRKLAPGLDLIPFEANSSQYITAVSIIILFMVKYGSKRLKKAQKCVDLYEKIKKIWFPV